METKAKLLMLLITLALGLLTTSAFAEEDSEAEGGSPVFISIDTITIAEPWDIYCLRGTLGGVDELYSQLKADVEANGVFSPGAVYGRVYPDLMTAGFQGDDTAVYAVLSNDNRVAITEPMQALEVVAAEYLDVLHFGPHEADVYTIEKALAWAREHDIRLGDGPVYEVYLTDESNAPPELLLTRIGIPLAPDQAEH